MALRTLQAACISIFVCTVATAHSGDAGARVDQETIFKVHNDKIAIDFITKFNRPAAFFLEYPKMDADADGFISSAEQTRYFSELCDTLRAGLELRIDGSEVILRQIGDVELSVPDPDCLRKCYRFEVPTPGNWRKGTVVEYHNDNYLDCIGSITIQIVPGDAVDVVYDARTIQGLGDEPPVSTELASPERDVVFRYRQGTGLLEPAEHDLLLAGSTHIKSSCDRPIAAPQQSGAEPLAVCAILALSSVCLISLVVTRCDIPQVAQRVAFWVSSVTAICLAAFCIVHFTLDTQQNLVRDELAASEIFCQLHGRLYDALKAHSETEIYDALATACEGDALEEMYIEFYRAALQREEENTVVRIRRIKPLKTEVLSVACGGADSPAFRARHCWRVYALVTHLNHTHARFNEYEADYLVRFNGQAWRIAQAEVCDSQRVLLIE